MKTLCLLFLFTLLLSTLITTHAQTPLCYTDQLWAARVKNDSSLLYERRQIDQAISKNSNNTANWRTASNSRSAGNPVVIPTVIYIVNDGTPASNISMQQIQSQMDQLNATYATYGYQFCLAKRNLTDSLNFIPQAGDSAGVFRITNALTNMDINSQDAALKALSNLPSQNYCRIFVVNSMTPTGVLGFAHFPASVPPSLDGIVVLASVFGSRNYCPTCTLMTDYDLGASLIHECGHYLNLYHTFQGGCYLMPGPPDQSCQESGDYVCDTPPTDGSFGCPNPAPVSCDSVTPELIDDFMDYTTDHCKSEFTAGQKARMDYSILAYRGVLIATQNLVNTGITCISLAGQYSSFTSNNFNGCLNDTMTFTSLNSNGFTYTWNFGDGATGTGVNGYHAYAATGRYLVTLTATNTGQHVNESTSIPVFITECHPIICGYNKWEFRYGYLDFSSGQPIATNHVVAQPSYPFPDYYIGPYRADSNGNPLMHIDIAYATICDTNFNIVDTLNYPGGPEGFFPCPGSSNKFCYMSYDQNPQNSEYTIVQSVNGVVSVVPGKRKVPVPFPSTAYYDGRFVGIPSCDGNLFWVLVARSNSTIDVFQLDANDAVTLHQVYSIPGLNSNIYTFRSSPDGTKIVLSVETGLNTTGFYILNFDKAGGNIQSYKFYNENSPNFWNPNGYCFSPNSRFLYCNYPYPFRDSVANDGYLFQYDLYNANPIATKKTLMHQIPPALIATYTDLAIGPDHKLYIGYGGNSTESILYHLAVVNFPDVLEDGTNSTGLNLNGPLIIPPNSPYQYNIYLTAGNVFFGDNVSAYNCDWHVGQPRPFSYAATSCGTYQFNSDNCFIHQWSFGDTLSGKQDTSTANFPTHTFSGPGTYLIKLNASGYIFTDTITITSPDLQLATSGLTACPVVHGNYSVAFVQPYVSYNWTVTNGTPASVTNATNIDVQWSSLHTSGTVKVVAVNSASGCADSITLPVSYTGLSSGLSNITVNATLCGTQTYSFYGKAISTTGTYIDTTKNANGCDSIITLHLTSSTGDSTGFSAAVCAGEAYSFFGTGETVNGSYSHTLQNVFGCDSVVTLHLTVKPVPSSSISATICSGDSFLFRNRLVYDAGNYYDTLQAGNGCDSMLVLHLNVYPASSVPLVVQNDTMECSGFKEYQWYYENQPVPGATLSFYVAAHTGHYYVAATDSNGCTSTSGIVDITSGINEITGEEDISVFPNPLRGGLPAGQAGWQLTVGNSLVGSALNVFDEDGRLIFNSKLKTQNSKLDLNLPSGIYYLQISNDKVNVVKKLVKM